MYYIIGLTGPLSSGKHVVAEYLKNKGFECYSLSQVVRDEAKLRGIKEEREKLQNLGNLLRETFGTGILADRIKKKLDYSKNIIIDGIRNPGEVTSLRELKNFILIGVTASKEIRFTRVLSRNRESDPKSFEEFLRLEGKR